uniref:Uncharacterized protein n=1 Tax=Plectus sambesii TaxID=2011161 RepID=A0A914X420_9BILA
MPSAPSATTLLSSAMTTKNIETTTAVDDYWQTTSQSVNGTKSGEPLFYGMDRGALFRMSYVLIALTTMILIYVGVKVCRMKRSRSRVRRYDILSAKQLAPELVVDSEDESEDELFGTQDDRSQLVPNGAPR